MSEYVLEEFCENFNQESRCVGSLNNNNWGMRFRMRAWESRRNLALFLYGGVV